MRTIRRIKIWNIKNIENEADAELPEHDVEILQLRKLLVKMIEYREDLNKNSLETSVRKQNQFIDANDKFEKTYLTFMHLLPWFAWFLIAVILLYHSQFGHIPSKFH